MRFTFPPLPDYVWTDAQRRITVPVGRMEEFAQWVQTQVVDPMTEYLTREPAFTAPPTRKRRR